MLDTKGLQSGLQGIASGYLAGQEHQSKLAQLAQQQELGGLQIEKAKQEAAQYPQQLAAQKQAREAAYMQGVSREIAQDPENMQAILEKHVALAPETGIDPTHLTWLGADLSRATSVKDLQNRAMYHANPQDYEKEALKAQFTQAKPQMKIQVDSQGIVHTVNEATGEASPVMVGGKPMKAQTPAAMVQIGSPNWETKQDAAGNLIQVNPKTGETRDIGVKGKTGSDKALTQDQSNALGYGTRMLDADKILASVGMDYNPLKINTAGTVENIPGLSYLANTSLSDNEQSVMQAQRNFINATLRRESGATISPSEFSNAKLQYFPQPGDSTQTVAQKAANRARAINSFKIAAGPAGSKFDAPVENLTGTRTQAIVHPQDSDAVAWAKANPNDPRSVQILKVNGEQ